MRVKRPRKGGGECMRRSRTFIRVGDTHTHIHTHTHARVRKHPRHIDLIAGGIM